MAAVQPAAWMLALCAKCCISFHVPDLPTLLRIAPHSSSCLITELPGPTGRPEGQHG